MILRNTNWMKVYKDLFQMFEGKFELACFASYLIDCWSQLTKNVMYVDGKEFRWLSDSFINGLFDMSSPTIRKYLKELEDYGFLEVSHKTSAKRSYRYIRLLVTIEDPEK